MRAGALGSRQTVVDGENGYPVPVRGVCERAGVRRFIFVSSVKVNGESTAPGRSFAADDVLAPVDAYGLSKLEAERGLLALTAQAGMERVILRPVLVYGLDVKANVRSMMVWLSKGVPLPLGATDNRRSVDALDNPPDMIATCMSHPAAAGRVFLVSDGEVMLTTELLHCMGAALDKPARLFPHRRPGWTAPRACRASARWGSACAAPGRGYRKDTQRARLDSARDGRRRPSQDGPPLRRAALK